MRERRADLSPHDSASRLRYPLRYDSIVRGHARNYRLDPALLAAVIYQAGVASSAATPDGTDVVLKGIDPASERRVSRLDAYLPNAERVLTRVSATGRPGVAIGAGLLERAPDGRVYKCPVVAGIPGMEVAQAGAARAADRGDG